MVEAKDVEPGGLARGDAGVGVLNDERVLGSEAAGPFEIRVGMGFQEGDVFEADEGFETGEEAGGFEDGFEFGAARRADDGEGLAGEAKAQNEFLGRFRNGRIRGGLLAEEGLFARIFGPEEVDVIGRVDLVAEDFEHGAIGDADAVGLVVVPGEIDAVGG